MQIKLMYKIHGLRVAQGKSHSGNTNKFYETEEEAVTAAKNCLQIDGYNRKPDSIIIYKAIILVRPRHRPVEVMAIEHGGEVVQLGDRMISRG